MQTHKNRTYELYHETIEVAKELLDYPDQYSRNLVDFDADFLLKTSNGLNDDSMPIIIDIDGEALGLVLRNFTFILYSKDGFTDIKIDCINQSLKHLLTKEKCEEVISIAICSTFSVHSLDECRNITPEILKEKVEINVGILPNRAVIENLLREVGR